MISLVKSPIYSVPDPNAESGKYDFNVCAGYSNPTFEYHCYDMDVLSVAKQGGTGNVNIDVTCAVTVNGSLGLIRSALSTYKNTLVYLTANLAGSEVYAGAYRLILAPSGNNQTLVLRMAGLNGAAAWITNVPATGSPVGKVHFLFGETVSALYSYRVGTTWKPLTESSMPVRQTGDFNVPFGEAYKGFFEGSASMSATVSRTSIILTEPETVETGTVICTPAQYWNVNYGDVTLLNARTGGKGLPTSGPAIWVDTAREKLMPCYANFVLNDGELENFATTMLALIIRFYKNGEEIALRLVGVPISAGLNCIDMTTESQVAEALLQYEPDYIDVFSKFYTFTAGDFNREQFENGQWITETKGTEAESNPIRLPCFYRAMDDRRGCFLVYPNGIGGLSNAYTEDFKRTVQPETVALRSGVAISSTVVRETEVLTCTFDKLTPEEYAGITGYDPRTARKVNGMEEARTVTRVLADGSEVVYIPERQNVEVSNQNQYFDVTITLYRAL